jgi:hypothetical protein
MRFKIGFTLAAITAVSIAPIAASAHDNGYHHTHQRSGDNQLVGGAIGAVTGAVIGSQLAANGARTEGSVLGAVIGGVAGAAIAGDGRSNNVSYHNSGYHNGGYYNPNTGYYGGYPTRTTTHYSNGYQQPAYRTYHTTTYVQPRVVYSSPYYARTYYSRPRTSVFINLNNNRGYGNRVYRNRGHNVRRVRHYRRRH